MAFYGRFTERAKKVLLIAQQEAQKMGHQYIGTEHILLGLLNENEGVAATVLSELDVTLEDVRDVAKQVNESVEEVDQQPAMIGYTPRTKRIIELSFKEAREMGHNYVGTEHILLALLREGSGVAAKIIMQKGVDFDDVHEAIVDLMEDDDDDDEDIYDDNDEMEDREPKGKALKKYGEDLTQMAIDGKLDPVIGRDKEIERIIQIMSRRTKNNPVLIGEPGVGKTAVAEGLAQRIAAGNIPELLKDKKVISLDLASMIAGAKYRGEFEERLKQVMKEIKNQGDINLFIDEMHTVIGAGAAEGSIDASNILKPALSRGEVQAIGATTTSEYRKHVEKDAAFERRFQPVEIGEPSQKDAVAILMGLRDRYEAHHNVCITDAAIEAAVSLSHRYISDRFLPDKAVDLIDEAASRVRLQAVTMPPEIKALEEKAEKLKNEKEEAVKNQDYENAAKYRDAATAVLAEIKNQKDAWETASSAEKRSVGEQEVAEIVGSWTGIPVSKLTEEEHDKLLKMEDVLHQRVIGQEEAVSAVSRAIRRARAGLKDPKRPIGSFIFLGPTGVGKTELCKALGEALFGEEDAVIRIDMSEYMERHTVSKLVGAPPGYVGYDEGGQLTGKVRKRPYSVVLFDEIEKAHPDVFNVLLQILEDGILTDSKGRTVDFRNTVIVMTSNTGAHTIKKQKTLGFATTENIARGEYEKMKEGIMEELKKTFKPEFLNRIDETIVFHTLEDSHLSEITELMLQQVAARLEEVGIKVNFTPQAKKHMTEIGFDPVYGARPLRRVIQKMVEDNLSEEILKQTIQKGDCVKVGLCKEKLVFEKIKE
jgi:ATP-dependent Clp protease ATP-binding subunit ClpC